ncbi:hypothetical protein ONE63_003040 [Megalurothrips usitatus]|uniref:Fatty acyl-CoA reductase n=1 Tax=Megalurothrips usitatus TaxID=439358 RepID=A0AAV7X638_9NEOP|nr:hypothetical protein ONE63_003040 [Megalurothrips usitatus]
MVGPAVTSSAPLSGVAGWDVPATSFGIPEFFAGRSVLVTGATGFMGKVLLEKLLRCCPALEKVYIVVRPKRGLRPAERVEAFRQLPLFEPLLKKNPGALSKLHCMEGDTSVVDMGLCEADRRLIRDNVSVVFHLAASVNWRHTLRKAVLENVTGTKNTLDFCSTIKNLEAFEYTSTAFCQCGEEVLEERVYPAPFDPHRLITLCDTLNDDAIEKLAPSLYGPHPNSYTYSKAVAEALVAEYADKLPIVIARPSIVAPTLKDPIPGWVDSLNGPIGILVASGKGVMRSMICKAENFAEVIPVDVVINGLIAATFKRSQQPQKRGVVPVFNACTGSVVRTTWGEVLQMGRRMVCEYPFEWCVWYPDGGIRTSWLQHNIIVFLFQLIPAYLIDMLLFIARQERIMVRVQNKIRSGHDLLCFFTMRQWQFENTNGFTLLWPTLNAKDQKTFFINNEVHADKEDYLRKAVFGARTYCLKESPDTIKYCRRRIAV